MVTDIIQQFDLERPWFLLLWGLLPIWYWFWLKSVQNRKPIFIFPNAARFNGKRNWKIRLFPYLTWLQVASLVMFIFALSGPRWAFQEEKINTDGIDIILCMDLSSSMLSKDFDPNRLEVSAAVARDFVANRKNDRIGIVYFSGEAYTQCPLTSDHRVVKEFLTNMKIGRMEDGTAIGMGLATAVNRLKASDAKSKIIILMTDGENNAGYIDPMMAAEIAETYQVKVYTIAVGSEGFAVGPVNRAMDGSYIFGPTRVKIDEELLRRISQMTGGKSFRATDEEALQKIYEEIDQMEKIKIEVTQVMRYAPWFRIPIWIGLALLSVYWFLAYFVYKIFG